jgi:hypothetical protein
MLPHDELILAQCFDIHIISATSVGEVITAEFGKLSLECRSSVSKAVRFASYPSLTLVEWTGLVILT